MPEELESVLRLVADGTLTPEQAAPIIDALTRAEARSDSSHLGGRIDRQVARAERHAERAFRHAERVVGVDAGVPSRGRQLRIRVTEHGRQAVNLRIPIAFVDAALGIVPGIGGDQAERIRQAIMAGSVGPIIDVEDPDGDGVLISVE
jgi:hypothetical protein